jgi:hypothetical protein
MLIEKVTLIEFDEAAERARVERAYSGEKRTALLAILEAFVVGDFAKVFRLACATERAWLGDLAMPVTEVLHEVFSQATEKALATKRERIPPAQKKLLAMRGIPTGPEGLAYPKFFVLGKDGVSTPATVPQASDAIGL